MKFVCVVLGVLMLAGPALARGCYSQDEREAEQGIRIHSELMVIGLNCQHMTPPGWRNFYAQYRELSSRHSDLFSGYEETLIHFFEKMGDDNPEGRIHDMRTEFANKVSKEAARMRPDIFCATFAPRIPRAAEMSRADFKRWAATPYGSHPVSRPSCSY